MRYLFYCCVAGCLLSGRALAQDRASAQDRESDSLVALLPKTTIDSHRIKLLMDIGDKLEFSKPEESRKYYTEALYLSNRSKNPRQEISNYINLGILFIDAGKYDSACETLEKGLALSKTKNFRDKTGVALVNMGNTYLFRNQPEKGVELFLESTRYLDKDTPRLAHIYSNIAGVFWDLRQYPKALEYGELAILYALPTRKSAHIFSAYSNTANVLKSMKQNAKAEDYYLKSLVHLKRVDDLPMRSTGYLNMAVYYYEEKMLEKAKRYSDTSLSISRRLNTPYHLSYALNVSGMIHFDLGHYAVARKLLYEALQEAKKSGGWKIKRISYNNLSTLEKKSGNLKKALEFQENYSDMKDSSLNEESTEKIRNLEARFESEKKEQQIKQLQSDKQIQALTIKQKNTLNYMLLAALLTLVLIAGFAYSVYKQKQLLQRKKIRELETEKKLTATEAILKGQEDERSRLAKDLHDGLGGMLSGVKYSFQKAKGDLIMTAPAMETFQRSIDMLDSSIHELRRVAHNLMPESLVRYGLSAAINDYCTSINNTGALKIIYQHFNVDRLKIDQSKINILYRIVQELINNILKHASAKKAIVQLARQNDVLAVTVEDDGKGFNTTLIQQSRGMGWANIYSRIDYLKGSLDIKSEPGKGTYVHITVKI